MLVSRRLLLALLPLLALACLASLASLSRGAARALAQPAPTTVPFAFTGAPQTWTVPDNISHATFDVYGAQGGNTGVTSSGGLGGRATATIAVAPGTWVTIMVGGAGGSVGACRNQSQTGVGGFNGGAPGGAGDCEAGGGGGASDIRLGGTELSYRVLVAGGGGGSANGVGECGARSGGAGGGLTGEAAPCSGGSGGDQTGARGSGMLGSGSAGVDGVPPPNVDPVAGGGGGGGYYGGAGGPPDGAGGGGSGFGPLGTAFETGVRAGNGLVTVTVHAPVPPPPTPPALLRITPPEGPTAGGTRVTITGTGFQPGVRVTFDGLPATNVVVISASEVQATSPAHPAGPVTVSV